MEGYGVGPAAPPILPAAFPVATGLSSSPLELSAPVTDIYSYLLFSQFVWYPFGAGVSSKRLRVTGVRVVSFHEFHVNRPKRGQHSLL